MNQVEPSGGTPGGPITVGIVDDHKVLADSMRTVLSMQADLCVVGTAHNCADALELVRQHRPQVLLLDVMMPDGDGITLTPKIKQISPETSILILTSLTDDEVMMRALAAGVSGFLAKNNGLPGVLRAVRQAAAEEISVPTGVLYGLLNRATRLEETSAPADAGQNSPAPLLTDREREILVLLSEGKSSEEITTRLVIAQHTTRTHIRNLMQKLNVHSRLQAVAEAVRLGLIEPPA
jgi:DNA-binding NarL/FixJ family response regulator